MVVLGGRIFLSKSKAAEFVRQIKDANKPGDFLNGEEAAVVLDALQLHPGCAEKVGLGVRRVGIYGNGETRSGYGRPAPRGALPMRTTPPGNTQQVTRSVCPNP